MKFYKGLLLILLASVSIQCSYRVYKSYETPEGEIASDCTSRLFKNKDLTGLSYLYKGVIILDESGITSGCKEEDAMAYLKEEACKLGANAINIVEEAYPDAYSSCYRCVAGFYTVAKDTLTTRILNTFDRDKVSYSRIDGLEWEDFSIELPEHNSYPYHAPTQIDLFTEGRTFWQGAYTHITAHAYFYKDVSKVKKSYQTPENLKHVNGLFDLAQIQARKLADTLNSIPSVKRKSVDIDEIMGKYIDTLRTLEKTYQQETDFGANKMEQKRWAAFIAREKSQMGT